MDGDHRLRDDGISDSRDARMAARESPVVSLLVFAAGWTRLQKAGQGRGIPSVIGRRLEGIPRLAPAHLNCEGPADAGQARDFSARFGAHQCICISVRQIEARQLDARVYWFFPRLMQTVAARLTRPGARMAGRA